VKRQRRTSPTVSRRTPLSHDRVIDHAMTIADSDGLEAVTMRRLAAALGVEAMSLYHHVRGKEMLLDGLVDRVASEIAKGISKLPRSTSWRTTLRRRVLAARTVMLRHRWAPGLIETRTSIPPSLFLHYEGVLGVMIEGGFSYHLAHRAMHALGSMTLGFVQELFSPASAGSATVTETQMAQIARSLPYTAAMVAAEMHAGGDSTLGWCDSQAEFEFTLDLLLDGLERKRKEERRPPAPRRR